MDEKRLLEPLGMADVEAIADDGMRSAAGGIYAPSVQEFATAIQRAFAQENGLEVRGLTEARKAHNAIGQRGAACGASAAPTGCASNGDTESK